jgi:Tol biopolymer transport system component/DNA-binding winged helix-turn-helix (wHTH) protein
MNRRLDLPEALIPVDLARESDFTLGALKVCPSRRQVSGNGMQETVQPRVMQALVALVRAKGAVVSREDLIESCWEGIVVGDDAINRCIAKVRALASFAGPQSFEIETVPRVGYRLFTKSFEAETSTRQSANTPPSSSLAAQSGAVSAWLRPQFRHSIVLAAVCILALGGMLVWRLLPLARQPEWTVVESHLPFIGTSQIEGDPALSPDGTMLAYAAGPNVTNRQIFLRILKGDSSIQLTHETFDAMSPAWSPDGRTIAYSVFQGGRPCRIMEMQIPSGQPYQVGQCRVAQRAFLTFDPSGHALVFNDYAGPPLGPEPLVRLDTENGRSLAITNPPAAVKGDAMPSFSPDGRYLVYNRDLNGARSEIRLRRMRDGQERVVATLKSWDCGAYPTWTPDGTAILMSGACQGDSSLWVYPLDGGKPSQIIPGGNSIGRFSVNANGYVAMETGAGHAQLLAFTPGSSEPPTPLDERSGPAVWCVDAAPDGALAVTGSKANAFGVWIADRQGAPFRKLMSLPESACSIRWSPDGTRFAFIQAHSAGFSVPVVSRGGRLLTRFQFPDKDSGLIAWAADGKNIFTSRFEKQGWRIWRTDLSTLKSIPVSPFGWRDPGVHGTMLFAEKARAAGIWRLDQGKPQRVADGPTPEANDLFTASGDDLYYADLTDPEHPAISAQNVYGGSKKRLIDLPFGLASYTFAVSPKSGDIVFSLRATDDTDIALIRLERR